MLQRPRFLAPRFKTLHPTIPTMQLFQLSFIRPSPPVKSSHLLNSMPPLQVIQLCHMSRVVGQHLAALCGCHFVFDTSKRFVLARLSGGENDSAAASGGTARRQGEGLAEEVGLQLRVCTKTNLQFHLSVFAVSHK